MSVLIEVERSDFWHWEAKTKCLWCHAECSAESGDKLDAIAQALKHLDAQHLPACEQGDKP